MLLASLRVIAEWRTKDNLFGLPGGSVESSWRERFGWNLGFYAQYDDISDTVDIGSRFVPCCFIGLVRRISLIRRICITARLESTCVCNTEKSQFPSQDNTIAQCD